MTTPDNVFAGIPASEAITTDWRVYFRSLAERACETSFGLPDNQRRVVGLCVLLDKAEARIAELEARAELDATPPSTPPKGKKAK